MDELVSIIMPNYNGAKYIKASIESVLAQTYTNWELLIVDDCSTDNSLNVMQSIVDPRIRIIRSEINSGTAVSRNYGLQQAKGRWIAFLDSDDLWVKDKLEKQITFMKNNNIAFSYTDYDVFDSSNKVVSTFKPKLTMVTYKNILKHNCIGCLTVMYDSAKLGKVLMPINAIKREDVACWLSILKKGVNAYCFRETLAQYRVHSNSVSANKFKMVKYQWNIYRNVEELSLLKCCYYMVHWGVRGALKYK